MPDAGCAVGVARRAAQHAPPEDTALNIAEPLLHVPLIAGLTDQHRHRRFFRAGRGNDRHGLRLHGNPFVVISADHVEVDHMDIPSAPRRPWPVWQVNG